MKKLILNYLLLFATIVALMLSACKKDEENDDDNNNNNNNNEIPSPVFTTFVDSRDDTEYKKVTIGVQVWMAENLKYLPSVVGPTTASETQAFYYVYDYNGLSVNEAKATENYDTYGVLYNWTAAMSACPDGFNLPSHEDWEELKQYVRDQGFTGSEGSVLKSKDGWGGTSFGGSDNYGFGAMGAGMRASDSTFFDLEAHGIFWTTTIDPENGISNAIMKLMYYEKISGVYSYSSNKNMGYSVRCIEE